MRIMEAGCWVGIVEAVKVVRVTVAKINISISLPNLNSRKERCLT